MPSQSSKLANTLAAALLLTLAAGCSGPGDSASDALQPRTSQAGLSVDAADLSYPAEPNQAELDAQWQAILQNPGTPGVDYDPQMLTLTFKSGAKLPPGIKAQKPLAAAQQAANQGNPNLRKLSGFEVLTDTIAARYGIGIDTQIYVPGMAPLAGFSLPAGANGDQIIQAIRQDFAASIESVTYSRLYYARYNTNDPYWVGSTPTTGNMWGHRRIGCETAWDFSRGVSTVQIAVVDTGVRISHEELSATVLDPEVAFPGQKLDIRNDDNTVEDTEGHGTFIAGVVGAQGDNGSTLAGVAHGCQIIPIKIANGGVAPDHRMNAGVVLAVDLGAEVVNLSWGGPSHTPLLQNLVNYCINNDVLFVCAAGNDGKVEPDFPAAYANSFTVGSTTKSDARSSFSNHGDYVDIAAPGQQLTSCGVANNSDYIFNSQGTSFAAPMVAAAAGLLLSVDPTLTPFQLMDVLTSTGKPTTGFSDASPVTRLDIGAAIAQVGGVNVTVQRPDRLLYSGAAEFSPAVTGDPDKVEAFLDGLLVQTLTAAPYDFSIDTSGTQFGNASLEFRATKGAEVVSATIPIAIDNTAAVFPLQETFDSAQISMLPVSGKGRSQELLEQLIKSPGSDWTTAKVDQFGAATWKADGSRKFSGSQSYYCSMPGSTYDAYEVDCLVTRRINLNGVATPTLVFRTNYNLEIGSPFGRDRGYVLVSADGGATWQSANYKGGGEAYLTGTMNDWFKAEVDLAPFSGSIVNIALVLSSDGANAGDSGGAAGFWIDDLTVAYDYLASVPSIGGVSLADYSLLGLVPKMVQVSVDVLSPKNVTSVRYILDVAPLGLIDPQTDIIVTTSVAPFGKVIDLSKLAVPNQAANLHVLCFDANDNAGGELVVPVFIFNMKGDTNADGTVNQADLTGYGGKLGLGAGQAGYIPFFDSDLDGVITELDSAAVGYNWGNTAQ